jgi:hypothetical protein
MEQPLGKGVGALVRDPEERQRIESVALLRRAPPVASAHHGHAPLTVRLGLGARLELVEVARPEPELHETIADWSEALVPFGIAKIGEARDHPVEALPLVVDLPRGPGSPELIAARQELANPRRAAYLFAERTDGFRLWILAEDVDPGLPAD